MRNDTVENGSEPVNPCLGCSAGQSCCSALSGLRLSREEFEKNFLDHSNELSVLKYKKVFIVSSLGGCPCPHWDKSGCGIYGSRPIDCRFYPFEITRIDVRGKRIEVRFDLNTGCPHRNDLAMSLDEARTHIVAFCQDVYGSGKEILTTYGSPERGFFSGVYAFFSPLLSSLSRCLRTYRQ